MKSIKQHFIPNTMKKIASLLLCFYGLSALAHNPQIETMTLAQDQQEHWTLHISSSFDGYRNQLIENYPDINVDELSSDEFQKLLVQYLRENTLIRANFDFEGTLKEGAIRLGHQTDMKFRLTGLPEELTRLDVSLKGFDETSDHHTVFKIITQENTSENFVLKKANGFEVSIKKVDGKFQLAGEEASLFWPVITLAILVLFAVLTISRMFHKDKHTLRPV